MTKEHPLPTSGYGMYSSDGVLLAHHDDEAVMLEWLKRPRTGAGKLAVRPIAQEAAV